MPKAKCCIDIGKSGEIFESKRTQVNTTNAHQSDTVLTRRRSDFMFKECWNNDALPDVTAQTTIDRYECKTPRSETKETNAKKHSSAKDILHLQELCEQINCPQIGFQIEKLTTAQDQLMRIQQRELFDRIFGADFICFATKKDYMPSALKEKAKSKREEAQHVYVENEELDRLGEEEEFICFASEMMELLPEQEWHGYFRGYDILSENNFFSLNENKKCIEIGSMDTVENIEVYLRAGVRCFMIDLFKGNTQRNQTIVVRFRQSELNVARDLGFPISSTLFARLSPRLQFTGFLETAAEFVMLCENDCVMLTTDRFWAQRCSKCHIFVNARYLLPDIRGYDIILIGANIQLLVNSVKEDSILCKVMRGGKLYSRMPVLFNRRCHRFRISFCELEDITFVKEVGINVIVSDIIGSKAYFDNLCDTLKLLQCENLRIFARIVINNIEDEDSKIEWAAKAYDGFLGEISLFRDGCGGDGNIADIEDECQPSARILFVNAQIRKLVECAHRMHKPFIFDPTLLTSGQYIMDPLSYKIVLYHPDKYLISSDQVDRNSIFYSLANALGALMPEEELELLLPYCDKSHTGSDTLALATAAASLEIGANCIFVVGFTGRMAAKIASFRPKATIYFITGLKSVGNYLSIHHNVVMLYYDTKMIEASHQKTVYTQFLFGLSYALKLKTLKHEDHVIFVYGQKSGQLLLDKYVAYKFDEQNFIQDLAGILF